MGHPRSPATFFAGVALLLIAVLIGGGIYLSIPWFLGLLIGINVATLALYGYDKAVAGGKRTRVPEAVLHGLALFGGSPSALAGQQLFRHKTVKGAFQRAFWLIVALQLLLIGAWVWCWLRPPAWFPPSLGFLFPG